MKKTIIFIVLLMMVSCGAKNETSKEVNREPASEAVEATAADVVEDDGYISEPQAASAPRRQEMVIEESVEMSEEYGVMEDVELQSAPAASEIVVYDEPTVMEIQSDTLKLFTPTDADGVGRLVYEIPDEMVKFKTYTIEVRIGQNENDVRIVRNLEPVVDTIIRTSELMQVELVDPTDISFRIVSQAAQQLVEPDEHTTWIFYVTPLRHGENYISVVVSIIKDGNLKQTVYKDAVLVQTNTWIEVKTFISNYWQWIIGFLVTVVIPFGIWLYKYIKKKKENS